MVYHAFVRFHDWILWAIIESRCIKKSISFPVNAKVRCQPSHHVVLGLNESTGVIQYIPRNVHTVFALLCFVVVIHWLIFPYPSGLLHWHCGNLRTLTFRTIWIYRSICHRLSLPLYNTHPTWLSRVLFDGKINPSWRTSYPFWSVFLLCEIRSGDLFAFLEAYHVQNYFKEEALADRLTKNIMTSWYHRNEEQMTCINLISERIRTHENSKKIW